MPYKEFQHDVEFCRKIHATYGKSFYAGTRFLQKAQRQATHILYAFVRYPDEYVDTQHASPQEGVLAKAKLEAFRDDWINFFQFNQPPHNDEHARIMRATKYIFETYRIPFEYSLSFIQAMLSDTEKRTFESYAELSAYMYGSATVVGFMMVYIFCSDDEKFQTDAVYRNQLLAHAKSLGEAFQMTNFLRDVGEDYKLRKRIYLPQDTLKMHGVTEDDIAAGKVTDGFKNAIDSLLQLTDALYQDAQKGIDMLPWRAGLGVHIASILYHEIHKKIIEQEYDVFTKRARLNSGERILLIIKSLLTS